MAIGSMAHGREVAVPELRAGLQDSSPPQDAHALPVHAAITTLTQNILGAGVLALPFAFKSAGLVGGLLLFGLIYVLSAVTMGALVLLPNHLGEFSYKGLALRTLPACWPMLVEVWVLCYTLGICTSYPILLGDFLNKIFMQAGLGEVCTKKLCMIVATLLVCWPMSCAPSLGKLRLVSTLGVASICFATVAAIVRYMDGTYEGPDRNNIELLNLPAFGECFPILVGAFGAHYNIPALFKEVAPSAGPGGSAADAQTARRRMMKVIFGALTLSSVVYGTVGVVVYATFGPATHSDFSENFRPDDSLLVAVRATMTMAICASFPLTMISARASFFNLFLRPRGLELTTTVRVAVATGLTALCLSLATAAGDIGVVLAYNGSVFGTPVCYIAPAVMYLCLPKSSQGSVWRACCLVCAALGIVFDVLGVYTVSAK